KSIKPLPDDSEHYLVFVPKTTVAYFCSDDPQPIRRVTGDELFAVRVRQRLSSRRYTMASELVDDLISVYAERSRELLEVENLRALRATRPQLPYAGYLSQTLFDSELLFASA